MKRFLSLFLALTFILCSCALPEPLYPLESVYSAYSSVSDKSEISSISLPEGAFDLSSVPEYSGKPYIAVNGNIPFFNDSELTEKSFEFYSELDSLGRCGVTFACIGVDIMPTEPRGEIGMIKPTGWVSSRYDFVDGKSLYNRCHLIGFQLSGENANRKNLITGTRYLNTKGMLPFENMVADYVKETENHVLYRVTPIFEGENLVASGVLMEGFSVEDDGEEVCFCVYAYNVQPGIEIDYATGENRLADDGESSQSNGETTYILNKSSKKFHRKSCDAIKDISDKNREESKKSRDELIDEGYMPCGSCEP